MGSSIEELAAFWNRRYAEIGEEEATVNRERLSPIVAQLRRHQIRTILDLGSGYGKWSIPLAQAGFAVTAVDISAEALRLLAVWARRIGLHVETIVSSAQKLDVPESSFDSAVCNSVLDHMTLADAANCMKNIFCSLKTGGIAYLCFDGLDEEEKAEFVTLADGSRVYVTGTQKGMLWRFYFDSEIKTLVAGAELLHFSYLANGAREVWIRKVSI